MGTIAEFSLPPTEFVLAGTLTRTSDVTVEVERMVLNGNGGVTPYFWAKGDSLDEFDDRLDDDITLNDAVLLEERDNKRFYRVNWRDKVRGLLYALSDELASIMSAVYDSGAWSMRVFFADQETLSEFHHFCRTYDISLELERLHDRSNPPTFGKYEVTPEQEAALTEALELGYFEVPRGASLEDVATSLDLSEQAVSARLRRGSANLIWNTLMTESED